MKATRTYSYKGLTVIEVEGIESGDTERNMTLFAKGASGVDTADVTYVNVTYYEGEDLIEEGTDTSQANRAIVDIHHTWQQSDF